MRDIGYDSYNPILNLGTLFILITMYALSIVLWAIIIVPMRRFNLLDYKLSRKIKKSLFGKNGIVIFIEGYIEFLIAARLTYNAPDTSVDKTTLSNVVAYTVLTITAFILPACYVYIMTKPLKKLETRVVKRRWFDLYSYLNLKSKLSLFYNIIFVCRRMVYV